MKVLFVVDSVSEINNKVNLLTNKFQSNIIYIVRADLVDLIKTYGITPNAIYFKNLTTIIQTFLLNCEVDDIIIYYSSLKINNNLLNKFVNAIGDKSKAINLMPQYNTFEQVCNSAYNVYVKSLFKIKDSMISPKLQFIPAPYAIELLSSHFGNRLFEIDPSLRKNITIEDKEINISMKPKTPILKLSLIACIIALIISIGLIASIAYYKVDFIIILLCAVSYISDLILTLIFICKNKFDNRFLK